MNIAIAGGTGFIGQHLTRALTARGDMVYILTRSPEKYQNTNNITFIGWLKEGNQPEKQLPKLDGIINLAGDSLFGYWTKAKKDKIYQSRINATYAIIDLIEKLPTKPDVLINASAVGYFGISETNTFTEQSTAIGDDFLAEVTKAWEETALQAQSYGVRTVIARLGIVLGSKGSLPMITLPFHLFIGGRLGSGKQWVSWIHIQDVVRLFLYALDHPSIDRALNLTAPTPVQNKELAQTIATTLHRPNWFAIPSFLLRTLLGEMSMLIISGQKVIPEKARQFGYQFQYETITEALAEIYD
ncbi:TIGR01777 family oxidoreductase [Gracilibacillus sp. S3-1-1]|uniref:TIGR01777 family oxidoreductase n=1 Tax=Gracilibacillus pellucidus TaxID=3095368 RepID=A0ACC6M9U2_9BACI|nr:TIGR01777 family oxidoreductase [Gracilibacillus sp. S3-1-1]MDX8047663.1 TIGR01777 family oxidoreductase [Gracilibacillus sp. S3-1-1]